MGRKEFTMGEFQVIQTQEEFDAKIKERLERERNSVTKQFANWVSPEDNAKMVADYQKQIEDIKASHSEDSKTISDLTAQVKSYETANLKSKVAYEMGLPYGMASRISGETEEDIRKDAESLKELIGTTKPQAPQAATEPRITQPSEKAIENAAYKKLLSTIKQEN